MKQVAARLNAGMSLQGSTLTFQPVVDALALAREAHKETEAVKSAERAARLFDLAQAAWQERINSIRVERIYCSTITTYNCELIENSVNAFNRAAGDGGIGSFSWKRGLFSLTNQCRWGEGSFPEVAMINYTARVLERGSIDPEEAAAQEAKDKHAEKLSEMEAWKRHLEENLVLKSWAKANPKLAEVKRREWNQANPKKTNFQDTNFLYKYFQTPQAP